MKYETLISIPELAEHLQDPGWAIVDCRFTLDQPEAGRSAYAKGHIPGAVYAHLEEDLSGPRQPGKTSRYPFPTVERFSATLSRWGIDEQTQVVVYDQANEGYAARLWRMLGWLGHRAAAVLDGGWQNWSAGGFPVEPGLVSRARRPFTPHPRPELLVDSPAAVRLAQSGEAVFVDTRSERSYTGQKDPTSPLTGHIPGAVHSYFADLVGQDGFLKGEGELRQIVQRVLGDRPASQAVFYCTAGVTACLNIVVVQHLGLGEARLYDGSWDEWITDPSRPVEKTNAG